jgi:hypothetical protein
VDRHETNNDGDSDQAVGSQPSEPLQAADERISLTVATMGHVTQLDAISRETTVAEVVDRVRREAAIDWDDIVITVRSGDSKVRAVSPKQTLCAAGVEAGDTLIFTSPVVWGSGWLEVAVFLGDSAAAGVVGAAAYDLLKATVRSTAARWRDRRGSTSAPSLSRDEALQIAQSCLSLSMRIEDRRDLKAVLIRHEAATNSAPEMWVVTFGLPDRSVEVKVSVPAEGPEHTMVLLDHHPR